MVAISKNGGPLPLVILGWIALSAICASYFAVFGIVDSILWKKISSFKGDGLKYATMRIAALTLLEPILWAGFEWLRGWLFSGFAWNYLGTAISQYPQYALSARFGGVFLVSGLVVMVNGVFATMIERILSKMFSENTSNLNSDLPKWANKVFKSLETAIPLLVVLLVVNLAEKDYVSSKGEKTIPVRAALLQSNEPCIFTKDIKHENPYDLYERLLQTAKHARPNIIILPESAMIRFGIMNRLHAKNFAQFLSDQTGGSAVFSGGDFMKEVNGAKRYYNAAAIYHPHLEGIDVDIYAKRHLVPFGEYIPLDKWIPILQKLSPIGISLYPGEKETVDLFVKNNATNLAKIVVGPLICFEDTDALMAIRSARKGAQLLILITNDNWFSLSNETLQHSWQSIMRCIETGLPMLRAGNNGVTGSISSDGRTNWLTDDNGKILIDAQASQILAVDVEENPQQTLYVKIGNYPLAISFALVLLFIFWNGGKRENII